MSGKIHLILRNLYNFFCPLYIVERKGAKQILLKVRSFLSSAKKFIPLYFTKVVFVAVKLDAQQTDTVAAPYKNRVMSAGALVRNRRR